MLYQHDLWGKCDNVMVIKEIKDVMNAKNDNKESIKFNKYVENYAINMEIVINLQTRMQETWKITLTRIFLDINMRRWPS